MVKTDEQLREYKEQIKNDIISARFNLSELPPTRERSLVRTKLDEALMWLSEVSDYLPISG